MKDSFTVYLTSAPREHGDFRLSEAEKKYLKRKIRLRSLKLLMWFAMPTVFIFLISTPFFLIGIEETASDGLSVLSCFFFTLPFLLCSIVILPNRADYKTALSMSFWLSLDNISVVDVTGFWGTRIHETQDADNLWTIGNELIEFPEHWAVSIDSIIQQSGMQSNVVTFRVVKFADATGETIRIKMWSTESSQRLDSVFADPRYFVLEAKPRSVEQDAQYGVGAVKSDPFVSAVGLGALILSVFLWIYVSILEDDRAGQGSVLERELYGMSAQLGMKTTLDASQLAERDLPRLTPHPEFGTLAFVGEAFNYVTVSQNQPPYTSFILSVDEYWLIHRMASTFPDVVIGERNTVKNKSAIDGYRNKLLAIIERSSRRSLSVRASVKNTIMMLSDSTLEQQMYAQGWSHSVSEEFVEALIPKPSIHQVESPYLLKTRICKFKAPLCYFNSVDIESKRMASPMFTDLHGDIILSNAEDLDRIIEVQREHEKIMLQVTPWDYFWIVALATTGFGALSMGGCFWARSRAKRLYKDIDKGAM
ncbi:hypothetical protein [Enterovibrio norvegicus]|uniref:hypothetical protein n=1 Tax=Enterovibrio norvegicus TaxID=188144 RepID=UPI000C828427|nr:hypothetical protein [Enterovibrio norvegicus]PMN74145.1 hypothetical protein BCT27_00780 [Enterovibrio norvegicus]